MKQVPWDPDVSTLLNRIEAGDLDLQPHFQRGEVWPLAKKQRLVDSILRDWHIPPVHVVVSATTHADEVLDGQQRLAAIRDFHAGLFQVDGTCKPFDPEISALDGFKYEDLPTAFKYRFNRYTVRVIRISDYLPEEPGELFFRLNQPSSLTAAEQRNAFYGLARTQVKVLVERIESENLPNLLGFSNARMSYDDTVAKVCYALDVGGIYKRINSSDITDFYRIGRGFSPESINAVNVSIGVLSGLKSHAGRGLKFNKATLFSWMHFVARVYLISGDRFENISAEIPAFIDAFERGRSVAKNGSSVIQDMYEGFSKFHLGGGVLMPLFQVFNDRSALRVSDVSSVVGRNVIILALFSRYEGGRLWREMAIGDHTITSHLDNVIEAAVAGPDAVEGLIWEVLESARGGYSL